MSIILWLFLLLLLLQQIFSSPANSGTNIILSLSLRPSPGNRSDILKRHADSSLTRAQTNLLKRNDVKVPLHHGGYSVSLGFGTPLQTLSFIADTGSSLTWFPCNFLKYNYKCTNCTVDPTTQIPVFTPNNSSSYKTIPCLHSRQCEWLSPGSKCNEDRTMCVYEVGYDWVGDTIGYLLNETLDLEPGLLSGVVVDNFTVGCSVISDEETEDGIVGLGRGPESLPAQMGLKSFSYCMVSRDDFDGNATGDLVLTTTATSSHTKFNYTPFVTNPRVRAFSEYYYVELQSIFVGPVYVKVPDEYVVPNIATGYGGTIVDSGTALTVMKKPLFDLVLKEFQRQVGKNYKRDKSSQTRMGLELCYRVPCAVGKNKTTKLPQLTFNFKGGVQMVLPLSNYFSYADKQRSVLCMTIMSLGDDFWRGPAIILGNYLQQDYYIKYDLENERLGIRQQTCK